MENTTLILIILIAYKLVLIGIGFWAQRRTKSESDFFLAGQGLGAWVAGLSYAASTSSAWVLLGFAGFVFAVGVPALWMIPGVWAGFAGVWLFLGPRMRSDTAEHKLITVTDFLTRGTHGTPRAAIAILSTIVIVLTFIFYVAGQFQGAGQAFNVYFGVNQTEAVIVGAVIILIYTFLGGFWAVSVTDALQGALMAVAAVIVPIAALAAVGGFGALFAALPEAVSPNYFDPTGGRAGLSLFAFVIGVMSVGAGALGQPQLLTRLMAVRSEADRKRGFAISMTWGVVVYIGMAILGLSARVLFPDLANPENALFVVTAEFLPPIIAGLVLAALLSAIMSTADSQLLVAASAIAHDLRLPLGRNSEQAKLMLSRFTMASICALAVALTLFLPESIFTRVVFAWTAIGAAFGPVCVARVLNWNASPWGVFFAILVGFSSTIVFYILPDAPGDFMERVAPWVLALGILFLSRQTSARSVAAQNT